MGGRVISRLRAQTLGSFVDMFWDVFTAASSLDDDCCLMIWLADSNGVQMVEHSGGC